MIDCKKTTCKHYMNEAERVVGQQLPPPACESCCHFYPSHFEGSLSDDAKERIKNDPRCWVAEFRAVTEPQEPVIAPALEEINDP